MLHYEWIICFCRVLQHCVVAIWVPGLWDAQALQYWCFYSNRLYASMSPMVPAENRKVSAHVKFPQNSSVCLKFCICHQQRIFPQRFALPILSKCLLESGLSNEVPDSVYFHINLLPLVLLWSTTDTSGWREDLFGHTLPIAVGMAQHAHCEGSMCLWRRLTQWWPGSRVWQVPGPLLVTSISQPPLHKASPDFLNNKGNYWANAQSGSLAGFVGLGLWSQIWGN